ncbi:MAG: hypothetical protein K2O61_02980 [Bacteroidaceae bacterium]|nr:hypothetical protein [Bacteroidaceae bacterium]
MKKYIFVATAILCGAVFTVTASNLQVTSSSNYMVSAQSRPVKVQKIYVTSHAVARKEYPGTFDEENMMVTFNGGKEKVIRNTDTGHGRENYTYKAGTCYYFN